MKGPSAYGPSAHVLGALRALSRFGDMYADPFTDSYPGYDPAHIAYVFRCASPAGDARALLTFVVKGRAEGFDPRGGIPVPLKDTLVARYFSPPAPNPISCPRARRSRT